MAAVEKSRIEWMDVLRGTSIILVVFNHAVLFASSSPLGALSGNAWMALAVRLAFGLGAGVVMVRLLHALPALDLLFAWPSRRVGTAASSSGSLSTSDGRPPR